MRPLRRFLNISENIRTIICRHWMSQAACCISLFFPAGRGEFGYRFFTEDPDGYCSLYRQNTVAEVLQWLHFLTEKIGEILDGKRSDCKNIKVAIVRKYINEHVTEHLSLNEVAEVFDISPNYLSQLFRKYNHTGFIEYVNICKIEEAKRLLEQEHLLVYEAADALGYESAFYFSKVFKKIEGISPKEYVNSRYVLEG